MSVSTQNAGHYMWGERCDGWRLLDGAGPLAFLVISSPDHRGDRREL